MVGCDPPMSPVRGGTLYDEIDRYVPGPVVYREWIHKVLPQVMVIATRIVRIVETMLLRKHTRAAPRVIVA